MMAAKSTTWSYLKRAWDNDLTFERASRSLAKTGLFFRVFELLFSCLFFVRLMEGVGRVFWRPCGSFWINFEVIWESFL